MEMPETKTGKEKYEKKNNQPRAYSRPNDWNVGYGRIGGGSTAKDTKNRSFGRRNY